MADRPGDPDPYLAEHVRRALAQDPRVGELGVDVEVSGGTVVLSGTLPSPERREATTRVVRDLLPGHRVHNETRVAALPEPTDAEHLP